MKVDKFESLSDLDGIIANMDTYNRLPLFAEDDFGRFGRFESQRVHGIVNTSRRHVTMSCGPEYPVFGHREAYGLVVNELKGRHVTVHGRVETDGDRSFLTILFNDMKVVKDDRDGVELGISFSNPMDRKTSFKGNGYTWRQWCSNGAGMKSLLPRLEINERHTSTMLNSLPAVMRAFIGEAMNQTTMFQGLVTRAMEQKVVFETHEQAEATIALEFEGVAEKHMKGVLDNLKSLQPTRWEMFNATTYYSSHAAISMDVRDRIDTIAEKFINVNRTIAPVRIVQRVAPIVTT
jgi:hypothetical protein